MLVVPQFESILKIRIMGKMKAVKTAVRLPLSTQVLSFPLFVPLCETRPFSPQDLSVGKQLFETNCLNCHVGGATLPDPLVSLSLTKLKGANPPRNNINSLVTYFRQPMTYDGSEESYWCRQVPESWMAKEQVESLAAFILTAAQKAPGWGAENF